MQNYSILQYDKTRFKRHKFTPTQPNPPKNHKWFGPPIYNPIRNNELTQVYKSDAQHFAITLNRTLNLCDRCK